MDLATFPRLKELNLFKTAVTGDIRDIGNRDFPALERLKLPHTVHGGSWYMFQQIAEVPTYMHAIHFLLQRNVALFGERELGSVFDWILAISSPDWYVGEVSNDWVEVPPPPFHLHFVQAGSRLGWCWGTSYRYELCEINWLDEKAVTTIPTLKSWKVLKGA